MINGLFSISAFSYDSLALYVLCMGNIESQSIRELLSGWVFAGASLAPRVLCCVWLKLKILWLASLVVVFALLTAPIDRPGICNFLFFVVTVDQFSVAVACEPSERRVFSVGAAPNTSLNVGTAVDIGNSFGSVNLAALARSVSFTLAGHSADHDVCSPLR
jgi:hypothetical protein